LLFNGHSLAYLSGALRGSADFVRYKDQASYRNEKIKCRPMTISTSLAHLRSALRRSIRGVRRSRAPQGARAEGESMQYRHELENDRWIVECIFPGLRNGFFVEAGATNGVNGSATYILETELAWSGLCIEPIPWQFNQISRHRNCATDNRALWREDDVELEFTIYPNRTGHSGLTAVNKNTVKMRQQGEDAQTIKVRTITLRRAFERHKVPRTIDYFCLDVEGAELEVLRNFDFSGSYLIRALSIEGHACDALMENAGYRRVRNPFTEATYETYWLHPSVPG
jgi:FkbM family methyltransferase